MIKYDLTTWHVRKMHMPGACNVCTTRLYLGGLMLLSKDKESAICVNCKHSIHIIGIIDALFPDNVYYEINVNLPF